ncbi:MAG: ornithine carbamoyltransferase [Candidatus Omnitrophica bacterium]|nr:ornithine carbamoyltransferase [Candidatus Omnitrophota bacterium]
MVRHFISLKYFSPSQINELIELTGKVKKNRALYRYKLKDKFVGLLFQKPSLRTKSAFYLGAQQLGAEVIYYAPDEVRMGERESIGDVAKTLSCYLDAVVLRTFSHQVLEEFVRSSSIPVVNGLSDLLHPTQVLADIFTLYELKRDIKKIKFAFIGDGNNVCHSFLYIFSILGGNIYVATPKIYQPQSKIVEECRSIANISKARIYLTNNPKEAAKEADVLYTDVWVSMGKEAEAEKRKKEFRGFTIDEELLKLAKKDSLVMHCLPAHRGEEITSSVIDSKHSIVFLQAENRLHSAKAILLFVMGGKL